MKYFIPILIFILPSVVIAQPSLTFNPPDGKTGVSTTSPIIINSDQRLNNSDGVQLNDDNVDALISFVDASNNPVGFDATVENMRRRIVITPHNPLAELTAYTITIDTVQSNSGAQTMPQSITFTTGDFTPPEFNTAKGINNTGTGFTFRVQTNEDATVYYVVDQYSSTPNHSQIENRQNAANNLAEGSGDEPVVANTDHDIVVSGLDFTPPAKYYVHFYAEDTAGNRSPVASRGLPLLNSASIEDIQYAQLDLRVNIDEDASTYYVVTNTSTPPTSAEIIAGTGEGGSVPVASGSFGVTANTDTDETISGLTPRTAYYIHFVAVDGAQNESVVRTLTAVTDIIPPVLISFTPGLGETADSEVDKLTLTFDENIKKINQPAGNANEQLIIYDAATDVAVYTVDREDINADGSSPIAEVTIPPGTLQPKTQYYILVGDAVITDTPGQNAWPGINDPTYWTFSTSGTVITAPTANICAGDFEPIGDIVISETGAGDFRIGTNVTLTLGLKHPAEFAFSNSGVTASGTGNDISDVSVSVGLTTVTVTYTISGTNALDVITIHGLKVYATGEEVETSILRTGGTASQSANDGLGTSSQTYATINVGATPPAQPQLADSQTLLYCEGADLGAATLTLVDQGVGVDYKWYTDPGLMTEAGTGRIINLTALGIPSPAIAGTYKYYVVAIASCQSAPPVEITVTVSNNPVADAGPDKIGPDAVCPDTKIMLGGNPTLAVPSAPGNYTYAWDYLEDATNPDPVANPGYTVTNTSTTTAKTYNFAVSITDVNGCVGRDTMTVEVKPTFSVILTSPNSTNFTPNSPNQSLEAVPAGGTFSGVGVIQSGASTYHFSPSIAHNTDPEVLPKNFTVYYTVTQDGCTRENLDIAIFTISDGFFSGLEAQYCYDEDPNAAKKLAKLSLGETAYQYVEDRVASWNNMDRAARFPSWQSTLNYAHNAYVRYGNDVYRCNTVTGCLGLLGGAPNVNAMWVKDDDLLKVKFTGRILNYYEHYYGGNQAGPTIIRDTDTYQVKGQTFNYYLLSTNIEYIDCPGCDAAYPSVYLEFERPDDILRLLPQWLSNSYYYKNNIVVHGGKVYQCQVPTAPGVSPPMNPSAWRDVTNTSYSDGQWFRVEDPSSPGGFAAGFYLRGQYVQINRNPTVFFSGLADGQEICVFDVLDLDGDRSASDGILYNLTGNFSNTSLTQEFSMQRNGEPFGDGDGAIQNSHPSGRATFNTKLAFGSAKGSQSVKIRYRVDPGTHGSAGPCYGESSIVVNIVENSEFHFDENVVDPENSIYCYTEPARPLQAVAGPSVIDGASNTPNSVIFSGYGVSNLQQSKGTFQPSVALEQQNPGTNIQQNIVVSATYQDANRCRSTRTRTFRVNPDIKPSFALNGRTNYCYEDAANSFIGHHDDFIMGGTTVSTTGRYSLNYRTPDNAVHMLSAENATDMTFLAQDYYDQVQQLLSNGGFTTTLNQPVVIDVIYTETLTRDSVCHESFVQPVTINPPVVLDIFGLQDGDVLCRNDNVNISQGNLVTFDGSVTGAGLFRLDDDDDFSSINPTLNSTVNTSSGKATINLLHAYNAAADVSDPRQVYLEYRYTAPGCTGPASVIKGFEISPPPAIDFDFTTSPAANTVFCNDAEVVELKTVQNTNVFLSGFGVTDAGAGTGSAVLNPGLAYSTSISNGGTVNAKQNINVTARISDAYGCDNTTSVVYVVNPIPTATVDFPKSQYCYEDAAEILQGLQGNSWFDLEYLGVTTPYREDIGGPGAPQPQLLFNPKERFDHALSLGASALTPIDFNAYYTAADADGCTNTVGPFLLSVANRIDVQIAGITDVNNVYCSNRNNGSTLLSFNPFPSDATKREFRINGDVVSLTSNTHDFRPPLLGGDYTLEYIVYSGEHNCSNTQVQHVKVLPSPRAQFTTVPACEGEMITFTADGSSNMNNAQYQWTLADVVLDGQTVQHRFNGTNLFGVNLKVEYPAFNNDPRLVCKDSLRLDQVIGANPSNLNFTYSNVCQDDETQFNINPDIPISRVSWQFGDGIATPLGFSADAIVGVSNTTGSFLNPGHFYPGAGKYTVVVTGKTADVFGGCERVEEHEISILTNHTPTPDEPYNMAMINGGNGAWVPEHRTNEATWEFTTAAKKHIITQEPAWITSPDEPYRPGESSYVHSPCFDLSAFSRPVLSIQHWTDTEASDGAVLQYSIDGGETWHRLGEVDSGLEWYNRLTISANPGNQQGVSSGWSVANQREWAVGKHSLTMLPEPRTQVRFRVAFASFNNSEGRDGFAFNNVVIEERNRTVLAENFTNLTQTANNQEFRRFPNNIDNDFNSSELVKLQYHHAAGVPNAVPDELYRVNPTDVNARAAFYGITNPVRAFIDGGYGQSSTNATFTAPDIRSYYSLRSLVTSPVNLSIHFDAATTDRLQVTARIEATGVIPDANKYNVFIAIAEQEVLGQSYVLRKFLPSAAGIPLTVMSPADPVQEVTVSYDMRHVTRLNDGSFAPFAVIVFVQHLETKNVLQTVMRKDGTASPDIITGIDPSIEAHMRVYPNPADDVMHVILPGSTSTQTTLRMIDSYGREAFSKTMTTAEGTYVLSVKDLAAGVYIIEAEIDGQRIRRKVMIVHD